jgi:hypothetical protein
MRRRLRLAILDDVAAHPGATTKDVRSRLGKPRATVDRQLQALHILNVLTCDEVETFHSGKPATLWRYQLATGINPDVLDPDSVPDLLVDAHFNTERGNERESPPEPNEPVVQAHADISGTAAAGDKTGKEVFEV